VKIIFKIVEHIPELNQIAVKFCYEKSRKSIDDYIPIAVNCDELDMFDLETFSDTLIRKFGLKRVEDQEKKLETLPDNVPQKLDDKFQVRDLIDKVVEGKYHQRDRFTLKVRKVEL
tara:strand:+ start:235 stop:582 length:348 start_codon:yes stop_codon:yes gene_type:complete